MEKIYICINVTKNNNKKFPVKGLFLMVASYEHSRAFPWFINKVLGEEGREKEKGSKPSAIAAYKGTNPILGAPPSHPHPKLITSQRPHSKYHHTGDESFSIWVWGGEDTIQSTT